ncbi:unnamed protein product, partial [Pylaiella littoralis]
HVNCCLLCLCIYSSCTNQQFPKRIARSAATCRHHLELAGERGCPRCSGGGESGGSARCCPAYSLLLHLRRYGPTAVRREKATRHQSRHQRGTIQKLLSVHRPRPHSRLLSRSRGPPGAFASSLSLSCVRPTRSCWWRFAFAPPPLAGLHLWKEEKEKTHRKTWRYFRMTLVLKNSPGFGKTCRRSSTRRSRAAPAPAAPPTSPTLVLLMAVEPAPMMIPPASQRTDLRAVAPAPAPSAPTRLLLLKV